MCKRLLSCAVFILLAAGTSWAQGWRGIVPLHSTRADVERLIGKPNSSNGRYEFEHERAYVIYSPGPCSAGPLSEWDVPRDTVIQINVTPTKLRFSALGLDLSKYEVVRVPLESRVYYTNRGEGVQYEVFDGGGDGEDLVLGIDYRPAARDGHLRCPPPARQDAGPGCPKAGGARRGGPLAECPTIEIVGPKGDSCRSRRHSFVANLGGIANGIEPTYKWSVSSGAITAGQGTGMIEVEVDDDNSKSLTVTVEIGEVIPDGCQDVMSYKMECPKP